MRKYAIWAVSILFLAGCSGSNKPSGFLSAPQSTQELTNEWEKRNELAAQAAERAAKLDEKIWGKREMSEEEWCKHWLHSILDGKCVFGSSGR